MQLQNFPFGQHPHLEDQSAHLPRMPCVFLLLLTGLLLTSPCHAIRGGHALSELSESPLNILSDPQQIQLRMLSRLVVSIQKQPHHLADTEHDNSDDNSHIHKHVHSYVHKCSGIIINNHWIITAAHCFDDKDYQIKVFSAHNELAVIAIGLHHNYQRQDLIDEYWKFLYDVSIENDYALIRISVPPALKTLQDSLTIQLPTDSEPAHEHTSLYVMGFGQTANIFGMGEGEGQLRISGPLKSRAISPNRIEIRDNVMGACQGDSGGPLFKFMDDKILVLATVSQGDCNTFSRYQLLHENILKIENYQWVSRLPTKSETSK